MVKFSSSRSRKCYASIHIHCHSIKGEISDKGVIDPSWRVARKELYRGAVDKILVSDISSDG